MLNGLDLFSGIGGITIALAPWVKPLAYCENDRYAASVLLSRMRDGFIPQSPIWDDVRTLSGGMVPGPIDIIYGGFPCQDISVAGLGAGLEGKRSGLFFEIMRLVSEINPAFVFLENVPAIRTRGGERVGKELASRGYDCRWGVVSAAEVGAPHLRKRWFLLAANFERIQLRDESRGSDGADSENKTIFRNDGEEKFMAHSERERRGTNTLESETGRDEIELCSYGLADTASLRSGPRTGEGSRSRRENDPMRKDWWDVEPNVGRVANGVSARMDRIKGLGNAVVPIQAREAFKRLMGI